MKTKKERNEITYDDLIETIELKSKKDLYLVKDGYYPNGKEFSLDLKRHCIFRGVSNANYELIPNSLRKNDDEEYVICEYLHENVSKDYHSAIIKNIKCDSKKKLDLDLQYRREFFVLFRFLDWADKSGLKISVDTDVRKLLHSNINHSIKYWPQSKYYEVIALAQHHGLPTCALDWSYNYKVSLYFAVKDILNKTKDKTDGALWAFNYKPFEKESKYVVEKGIEKEDKPQLRFYRPQYFYNSNLKAQKGLFTFLINNENTFCSNEIKTLDYFIYDIVKNGGGIKKDNGEIEINLHGIENFTLKKGEKVFYKFIIKNECKAKILEELYLDYYSEEYLFPGYQGVADAMKNWATLQNIKMYNNSTNN